MQEMCILTNNTAKPCAEGVSQLASVVASLSLQLLKIPNQLTLKNSLPNEVYNFIGQFLVSIVSSAIRMCWAIAERGEMAIAPPISSNCKGVCQRACF